MLFSGQMRLRNTLNTGRRNVKAMFRNIAGPPVFGIFLNIAQTLRPLVFSVFLKCI